ncbi:hemopexin repeat-containing protein [Streptomyces sp. NRRL B-1347]|uniref:hemopexin repeat-containing protein n=1 Tax=Streptomyces sp. NRRL B-1347 TaxID=1476877 RepID=UPI0004C71406|nr:hemopexin repeat-containing protein [Streptomyces sp. NRRL B-1347]
MIQAALTLHDEYAHFFRGGQFIAYNMTKDTAPQGVRAITDGMSDLAGTVFADNLDAAVEWLMGSGEVYLFKGDQCAQYDVGGDQLIAGPVSIAEVWPELDKVGFGDGLDAALWFTGKPEGELPYDYFIYFFKGDQYVRYDARTDEIAEGPKRIAAAWPGLEEAGFDSGIDATTRREVFPRTPGAPSESYTYFFKGDEYLTYDMRNDEVVTKPRPIADGWGRLSDTDFAGADAPAATERVARAWYTLAFAHPGERADPEPEGKVWLRTKDGAQFRLWTQRKVRNEAPARTLFANAVDLPFSADDIAAVHADVDEGDGRLARGSVPFTGNGTYTLASTEGSVTVELTVS